MNHFAKTLEKVEYSKNESKHSIILRKLSPSEISVYSSLAVIESSDRIDSPEFKNDLETIMEKAKSVYRQKTLFTVSDSCNEHVRETLQRIGFQTLFFIDGWNFGSASATAEFHYIHWD
ncbi:hypothetical protein [Leptospira alexanderi]|uniref:hypothetical protein n=1 Tax=Leptospira alexanderi TaxID=100053 RepID=UPI000990EE9D|nr:hypothetical protein [Leptospira alexanderi]